MTLTLEILAGWIAFNVAFGAWRIWITYSNPEEEASSGNVAVAGNKPSPGQRPSRINSVELTSNEVLP